MSDFTEKRDRAAEAYTNRETNWHPEPAFKSGADWARAQLLDTFLKSAQKSVGELEICYASERDAWRTQALALKEALAELIAQHMRCDNGTSAVFGGLVQHGDKALCEFEAFEKEQK
jgi:hypothetical protein